MIEVRCEDKEGIAAFVLSRLGKTGFRPAHLEVLGVYRNDQLIGGALFCNFVALAEGWQSVDVHIAGCPGWLSRKVLSIFGLYVFEQLKCSRVVGRIAAANIKTRCMAERAGWQCDGVLRSGIRHELNTCIYTLTRADYFAKRENHGR